MSSQTDKRTMLLLSAILVTISLYVLGCADEGSSSPNSGDVINKLEPGVTLIYEGEMDAFFEGQPGTEESSFQGDIKYSYDYVAIDVTEEPPEEIPSDLYDIVQLDEFTVLEFIVNIEVEGLPNMPSSQTIQYTFELPPLPLPQYALMRPVIRPDWEFHNDAFNEAISLYQEKPDEAELVDASLHIGSNVITIHVKFNKPGDDSYTLESEWQYDAVSGILIAMDSKYDAVENGVASYNYASLHLSSKSDIQT